MVLVLDAHLPLVWRSPNDLQLGIEEPVAIFRRASHATQAVLGALKRGTPLQTLEAIATQAGMSSADLDDLLTAVEPALDRSAGRPQPTIRVLLGGGGPTLAAITSLLTQSGVAVIDLDEGIATEDCALTRGDDGCVQPKSLAVIVSHHVVAPFVAARLLRRDTAHLPIVFGERTITVGPFVEPGFGPCTRCIDLFRRDRDPAWPAIAAQLHGKSSASETPLTVGEVAGITVRLLQRRFEGKNHDLAHVAHSLDSRTGFVSSITYAPHSECGCQILPEIASDAVRAPR